MPTFGASILAPLCKFSLGYADVLLKDVPSAKFAVKPRGIDTNHPAFIYGHLALYPERLLDLIGRTDLAQPDATFTDLFAAGKPCVDDPAGTVYPAMDAIVGRFRTRYEAVLTPLAEAKDEVFHRPNPNERMRDRFPTVGLACAFLVNGHLMMHLGQMSAWRRCMGMPSAT
jgi:hypothetical protein